MGSNGMKKTVSAFGAVMLSLALAAPVFAETISGQITNVNQQNNTVTLQPQNQQKFQKQDLQIKMKNGVFQNNRQAQSINDLSVGDQITVEADRSLFGGDWEAKQLVSVQNQGGRTGNQGTLSSQQSQGQQQEQMTATQNQGAGMPLPETDFIVRGTVVSADPASNRVIVTDYATGLDRTFTVMDTNVLRSIQAGQEVALQSADGKNAQSVQQSRLQSQSDGASAMQASGTSEPQGRSQQDQSRQGHTQSGESQPAQREGLQDPALGLGQTTGAQAQSGASS